TIAETYRRDHATVHAVLIWPPRKPPISPTLPYTTLFRSRSAKPFCKGETGAVGLSRMPVAQSTSDDAAINAIAVSDHVAPEPRHKEMPPRPDAQPIPPSEAL